MIGILWLIRYACSGLHFGDPAAKTAQAQQNQQQQAQNTAQQSQQQAMFNLQNYLAQNPNPFQNIGIQGPQTQQQMPGQFGGGFTTGSPLSGMLGPMGGGAGLGGGQPPHPGGGLPTNLPPHFGAPGGTPPQIGAGQMPGSVRPPMMPPGARPPMPGQPMPPGMHTMPGQLPPAFLNQLMQAQQQGGVQPGAPGVSGNFRKGSYGNLL